MQKDVEEGIYIQLVGKRFVKPFDDSNYLSKLLMTKKYFSNLLITKENCQNLLVTSTVPGISRAGG